MSIPTPPADGGKQMQAGNAANPPAAQDFAQNVQQQQQTQNNPVQWVCLTYNPAAGGGYVYAPPAMVIAAPPVMYPSHAAPPMRFTPSAASQMMYTPHAAHQVMHPPQAAPQGMYPPQAIPQMMPAFHYGLHGAAAPWPNVYLPLVPAVLPTSMRRTEKSKKNDVRVVGVVWEEGVDSNGNRVWKHRDTKVQRHSDPYK